MNFLEIKDQFKVLSGRYDLVDDDSTKIINNLINQASRFLDRITDHSKSYGSHFYKLLVGEYQVVIPYCRSVMEVWIHFETSRNQLKKMNLQDIVVGYLNGSVSTGSPEYYSPVITRKIPEDADLSSFTNYMNYLDTITNTTYMYNGIVIVPPTDVEAVIEVRGYFYSKELSNDTDENYWTVMYPNVLLKAAMRELEIFNLNRSKVATWTDALNADIEEINKDFVQEITAEIDSMKYSL